MERIIMPYCSSPTETQQKAEAEASHYLLELQGLANTYGLHSFSLKKDLTKVQTDIDMKSKAKDSKRAESIPLSVWEDSELRTTGAFYSELIYPLLAKGKDAYKPTDEAIYQFCRKLASGEPINIIQYYTLSKTQSPKRTGSPNHVIDLAEVEMLKYYAVVTKAAQHLGLNLGFVTVDENDIFPRDEFVGGSEEDALANKYIADATLRVYDASNKVIVRSLYDSVVGVLGEDFTQYYDPKYIQFLEKVSHEISAGEQTVLSIRMFTFLDCTSDKGLELFGLTPEGINQIRSAGKNVNLKQLPGNILNYYMSLTAHVASLMDLRDEAAKRIVLLERMNDFPEYNPDTKLYGGVTRSKSRWGFLPSPIRYNGKTLNPMHGLAVYAKSGVYRGVAPFNELQELESNNKVQIIRLGNKPVFALIELN